ncbi:MAG: transcriptional regulator [Nitrosopumilaceae archaeon]
MVRKKVKLDEKESFSFEKESIEKEIQEVRSQLEEISQHPKKKKKHVKSQKKKLTKAKKAIEKKSKEKLTKAKETIERKKPVEKKQAVPKKVVKEAEEEFDEQEIENLQIGKMDMEKLTGKVCDIIGKYDDGIFQSDLWKKLKLTSRDGSRLAVKLEKGGIVEREKVLEDGRWTYKLKIKRIPVSTQSLEDAPCLICPVEQKCSLDGEISPRTCQWIEEWVTIKFAKSKGARKSK